MTTHPSLLSVALLILKLILTCCHARPVYEARPQNDAGQKDKQPALNEKKGWHADKDWLTLGISGSSSQPPSRVPPIKTLHDLSSQARQERAVNLSTSLASRPAAKRTRMEGFTLNVKKKLKSFTLGAQKVEERAKWESKHPNKLPPVRLLPQHETMRMGLHHQSGKYKAITYLEEKMMSDHGIDWPLRDIKKPTLRQRLRPLVPIPLMVDQVLPSDHQLIKKQAEINHLLEEEGVLFTSDDAKWAASELTAVREMPPRKKKPSTQ